MDRIEPDVYFFLSPESIIMIQLQFIDHVAINVRDMEVSAAWYEKVLGMQKKQAPEWQPAPIMMQRGNFNVAIFPVEEKQIKDEKSRGGLEIDHFAFRVDMENFLFAQKYLKKLAVSFTIKNHIYFQSLYMNDPDGHIVELTTFIKPFH